MQQNVKDIRWNEDVKYDVVQFNLENPTSLPVVADLFDTTKITDTPVTNAVFAPVANQSVQPVSGATTVCQGMGYLPSLNYMFITAPNGTRVVWDVTNKVQVSQYSVAASSMFGNIIERPSDGRLWGASSSTSDLIQSNWQAQTQTLFPVTGIPSEAGVFYDEATDTIFFGYASLFFIGAYNLTTNTLTNIPTPSVLNFSLAVDKVNRKIYGCGFSPIGALISEINMDTLTFTASYNFNPTGLTSITRIGLEPNSGKIYATGGDGVLNRVGLLNVGALSFTTILSNAIGVFGRFLNLVFTNNTLFVFETQGTDTITTINTISDTIIDNQVSVFGDVAFFPSAFMLLIPSQYIYVSKGTAGISVGRLNVFPITQQFYITGSINYNFFVRSIFTAPKRAFAIEINVLQKYLPNEWVITNKDSNGQECSVPYLPNNFATNFQFDSNQALITFEDGYLMDITSKSRYVVPANTTVVLLLWYKEMRRSEKLTKTVDFSNDEGAMAASVVNQQDRTAIEIEIDSGRNVYNYWKPRTVMVDELTEHGAFPIGWQNMEKMIPKSMIIEDVIRQ